MLTWLVTALAHAAVPPHVADAMSVGDCAAVIEALPSPEADDERLVVGACLGRTGQDALSAEVLAPVTDGVYGEYARLHRARALLDQGEPAAALAALDDLTLPGATQLEVRLLRGGALVALGRSLDAREDLRDLLRTDVAPEARFLLARGGEDRGERDAAIATYRAVWARHADGAFDAKAAERLAALGVPVTDLSTPEARDLAQMRIEALTRANRHGDALALLTALRDVEPGQVDARDMARATFRARDYPASIRWYQQLLGEPKAASGPPRDLFDYALATSRTGDYATADTLYRRLVAEHPESPRADEASFKLGYLAYDDGDLSRARTLFREHINARPTSRHLDEALWFAARSAWREGDRDDAVGLFRRLVELRPRSSLVPGARYWTARAAGLAGSADGEREGLEEVVRRWPVSGYAWYAAERLGRTFPAREQVAPPPFPGDLAEAAPVRRGQALLAVGMPAEARAELGALNVSGRGRDAALAYAHALIRAGDYVGGRRAASPYCVSPWEAGDPVAQQACTPMPEASVVQSVAARYDLDPLVPFGIMTAESALKPWVTSAAGARGLMQLMPEVGARLHAELYPDRPYDPAALYSAPYNASLGTAELGRLRTRFDGALEGTSMPAVIAGYNAGEDAVRRWLDAYDAPPPFDAFAEDIGYTETRNYVRRVLGFTMAYRWVYGDRAPVRRVETGG